MRVLRSVAGASVVATLAGLATHPAHAAEPGPPRPNVVLILADDLGAADLGRYGQARIRTPRLDRMADEGRTFTHAYAGSPICAPSRAVLMTGQHTGTTLVRGNFGVPGWGVQDHQGQWRVPLRAADVTLAEVLRGAGYRTGVTGKWGLGEPGTDGIPTRQGFDEWYGLLNQQLAHSHWPRSLWLGETEVTLPGNTGTTQDFATGATYAQDEYTRFALEFLDRHAGPGATAPFFLYVAYTLPHSAFQVPALEPYVTDQPWTLQEKTYASMVTRLDRDVGRILDRIDALGAGGSTLVLFASDNGAAQRFDGRFDSSGALRGRKRDVYEGGIRSPLIARWTGTIPAGTTSDVPWYLPDVLPTLAELAGAPVPAGVDGVSVAATLRGGEQPELRARPLYWEFHEGQFAQAIRRGDWKAVRQNPTQPTELYHLPTDPGEASDVAAAHPALVREFEGLFVSMRRPSPIWTTTLDAVVPPSPETARVPEGWLPLDDAAGATARDHSGRGSHGALVGFASPGWVTDADGLPALDFAGAGRRVVVGGAPGVGAAQPRTVAAWIRTTGPGAIATWGDRTADGRAWVFRVDAATGTPRVEVSGGFARSSTVVTDGRWRHVAAVFDPVARGTGVAGVRFFVDGVADPLLDAVDRTVATAAGTAIVLGVDPSRTDLDFPGRMRDVRWWPRALDAAAIARVAQPGATHARGWFVQHFPEDAAEDWPRRDARSGHPLLLHYATGVPPGSRGFPAPELLPPLEGRLRVRLPIDAAARVDVVVEDAEALAGPWRDARSRFDEATVDGHRTWQARGDAAPFSRLRVSVRP